MSGPVWRFEPGLSGICDVCFRDSNGLFVEGEVIDNQLLPSRRICPTCMQKAGSFLVTGEAGRRRPGPAYAAH